MNREAVRHCNKASYYLTSGEDSYRKAGAEMLAAKRAGATWKEVGAALGRSSSWCIQIVRWAEQG